ncbi:N-acetylneuraminate synthase family protein [Thermopetrobacter sp. TC1]|uniref:N-acetylneuraminate synthase family protein n=1 Tax=Thermopetrobacter sp. TC1 TaxID=1495045 RepID=UPI0006892804|nr:N-acetylneuraminate synthase family protein [Thermopetrobacter sp. TC1]
MWHWLAHPSPEARCAIIAEIAQAHDGSLGFAHAMIDAAAEAGVDAVKFQTHIADAESTPGEPWRVKFSPQDETRYDYWKRMEFTPEQWAGLKRHAEDKGLAFLSSPFSMEAVELLRAIGGVAAWKVASGEVTNVPMLIEMCRDGIPILLSSGMSDLEEIGQAVRLIRDHGNPPLCLMQCTSSYPTPPEKVGINVMCDLAERFSTTVGLSDHSATIFPGLIAAWEGAKVIEVHLTLSRRAFGPDVVASLTVEEMAELVRGVRFVEAMRANPLNKAALKEDMARMRATFMKSLMLKRDMKAGEEITEDVLIARKPGTGLPASDYFRVLGRKLKHDVPALTPLKEDDIA